MPEQLLRQAWEEYGPALAMRTDFGLIDLPLLSMIARICPELRLYFVGPHQYPARHLRFRDKIAARLGLRPEICGKEPKELDRSVLLQSDLGGTHRVAQQGRDLLIRPLAGWTLDDVRRYLKEQDLSAPADFVCLPSRNALADWLGPRLKGPGRLWAHPLSGLPSLTRHRVFHIFQSGSGPMGKVLGLAGFDGQNITGLEDVAALGILLAREGKPVENYSDRQLAQWVNAVLSGGRTLEILGSVATLKRPGCRLDGTQAAAVRSGFQPLQRGPGNRLVWTTLAWNPLQPGPTGEVARQTLHWEAFQLTLEAPWLLSSCVFESVPSIVI